MCTPRADTSTFLEVGLTAISGAFIGLIASELRRLGAEAKPDAPLARFVPVVPDAFWAVWGSALAAYADGRLGVRYMHYL